MTQSFSNFLKIFPRIWLLVLLVAGGWALPKNAWADDVGLPTAPSRHFNDYAGLVSKGAAEKLDATLREYEQRSSNQMVVAIFPSLDTTLPLETYCLQTFNRWGIGKKGVNNGVVIFLFAKNRKMRIQVGRGLESVLPDNVAQEVVDQMTPYFAKGDFGGGLSQGISELMARLEKSGPSPMR